jgi:hypothetical protein
MINYGELYPQIGLNHNEILDRDKGSHLLAEVNKVTLPKDHILLTSIVTAVGKQEPNDGYFDFAVSEHLLDEHSSDTKKLVFWSNQVTKVFNFYR